MGVQWVAAHRAAMVSPYGGLSFTGPPGGFAGRTVRQVVHLHRGGPRLRVWLSNQFGDGPLRVGEARVGRHLGGGRVADEQARLTFGGSKTVEIVAGTEVVSDLTELAVPDDAELAVSLYIVEDGGSATHHPEALQTGYVTAGNTAADLRARPAEEITSLHWIKGVDLRRERSPGEPLVAAFGDSLTDGSGTTPDAHQRYPDHLSRRLGLPVLNLGIGGNRLLCNGFGPAGLLRFQPDVLAVPGLTHVIIALGINDLGLSAAAGRPLCRADDLISGLTTLARLAREAGVVPIGATLPPYAGAAFPGYHCREGDRVRAAVNDWIRTTSEYRACLDVDAAVRDPRDPSRFHPDLHCGDGLHPNDAGARAMAHAVDLEAFLLDR
ncbi:GDSL-type esterase/lipase family protein [Actinocorallia populi]|uniref:GDSL-type esterase/lipase family protein n=1 Tax=Actinocorallia populi TaxID=2079200 RepID=UPI000D089569|nr:GDSL-type esterase/lipase family protein [Actinocorallia populi]